jgi:Tol biopolymer transport system component
MNHFSRCHVPSLEIHCISSTEGGQTGLAYLRKTDGSPAIKLGQWGQPVLSPDGKQVLSFGTTTLNLLRLVLLPTGVGETRMLDSGAMQQASSMGWMPDGKAIYFAGDDGQRWRMYIQEIAGTARHAVTPLISLKRNHFESHIVSSDGKLMFARDVNGRGQLYPIAGGEPRAVPGWSPEDLWINWAADGRSAYVYADDKIAAPVYRLDLNTGKRDLVATLAPSDSSGVTAIVSVRMTADGKAYAYSFSRELSDLFLVEGVR